MINDDAFLVNVPRLLLVTEWNKYFSYPKYGTLRSLIFNAETNGFNKVIRRINSRILLSVPAYYEWIEENNKMQN